MFQRDLHRLVQHNSNTSYPGQNYDSEDSVHGQPQYTHDDIYRQARKQSNYQYQQQHHDNILDLQYDGYSHEYQGGQAYADQYSTPATSPPTPSMDSQGTSRTRSSHGIPRSLKPMPETRSRPQNSPKPKRVKKEKVKAEKKGAKLEKPLSELTKNWKHVPVADIDAFVNRSAEERRKEVEEGKIPGKVKRPMNSFMLYRKAYQNRTKDWALQNNHQVVSQVCGESWPLEPDEIKEQFSTWAKIERLNHQNAHPGYKFSPSKPGVTKAQKRKMSEELDSEESGLDDWEWQGSRKLKRQRGQVPRQNRSAQPVSYPTTASAYQYSSREHSMDPNYHPYQNRSAYGHSKNNPGQHPPPQYNQDGMAPGQYYQQTIQPHPNNYHNIEDVIIRKATTPGMHSSPGPHSVLGLPGGFQENDLLSPPQYHGSPAPEYRIDPSLLSHPSADQPQYEAQGYQESHPEGVFFGNSQVPEQQWHQPYGGGQEAEADLFLGNDRHQEGGLIHDPHVDILRGSHEGWQTTLDPGAEFDNWMGEEA